MFRERWGSLERDAWQARERKKRMKYDKEKIHYSKRWFEHQHHKNNNSNEARRGGKEFLMEVLRKQINYTKGERRESALPVVPTTKTQLLLEQHPNPDESRSVVPVSLQTPPSSASPDLPARSSPRRSRRSRASSWPSTPIRHSRGGEASSTVYN